MRSASVTLAAAAAWIVVSAVSTGAAEQVLWRLPAPAAAPPALDHASHALSAPACDFVPAAETAPAEVSQSESPWHQDIAGLMHGRSVLEGGYSYLQGSGGAGSQHALPDLLLRVGLSDRIELRLGWPGYVHTDPGPLAPGDRFGATLDPNIGLAVDLWDQRGLMPQSAVLVAVPMRLQGNPFALHSLQPLTELWYAWQTSDRTSVSGRSGVALFDAAGDRYTQFQQGLSCDVSLTERLAAFASWDMLANQGSWNDSSQHMAGGGLAWLLTERLAVSGRLSVGLNEAAPNLLTDIRFSLRF